MCGLIGFVGDKKIANLSNIKNALSSLAYRGYDSAGVAFVSDDDNFFCFKSPGIVEDLFKSINLLDSIKCAIGHTRWATHGDPASIENAHPHVFGNISVVHNGIIRNYEAIKEFLNEEGYKVDRCETDSSIIPILIDFFLKNQKLSFLESVKNAVEKLNGIVTIIAMFAKEKDVSMVAFKRGAPLILGVIDEKYAIISSDVIAISNLTDRFVFLEDEDFVFINKKGCFKLLNADLNCIERKAKTISSSWSKISKGHYKHYMMKEISENPIVFARTISSYWNQSLSELFGFADLLSFNEITLVGCGSSYYACFIAAFWFRNIARIKAKATIASEFSSSDSSEIALFVSQSGETADILNATEAAKRAGLKIYGIVNIANSALARVAHKSIDLNAGPEISVPTTKVFIAQLAILFLIAVKASNSKFQDKILDYKEIISTQYKIAAVIESFNHSFVEAKDICKANSAIYIASGELFGVAMEGALKLKEVAYLHTEAINAGEFKHGSLALIESGFPVFILCPSTSRFFHKLLSTVEEINARKGFVIAITDEVGKKALASKNVGSLIVLPYVREEILPFLYSVVVQLISYKIAVLLDRDIDKPRNLAKSVTVE